jgi:UDP-N-acetylmuramate dehydrogenase
LIVREKGIRGITVKLFEKFNKYEVTGCTINAQAGILLSKLSQVALQNELTGLEFASGIPGTLGGAVAMNAGAYGGEMKDVVAKTQYIDNNGDIKSIEADMHCFGYRTSFIQKEEGIVLNSELKLKAGDKVKIKALMDDLCKKRNDKQPLKMPSAGSVFKRPEGYFAGKLIEDCGLRGYSIGGAEVSNMHCGFIVNKGDAVAGDVIALIEFIKRTVKEKFGVDLETEVKVIGEE